MYEACIFLVVAGLMVVVLLGPSVHSWVNNKWHQELIMTEKTIEALKSNLRSLDRLVRQNDPDNIYVNQPRTNWMQKDLTELILSKRRELGDCQKRAAKLRTLLNIQIH
jgi:hypothetical protein